MKILLLSDHEERALWDGWSEEVADRLSDVELILSAGDLDAGYLEFLVTMLNVPLVYVHGNHDTSYLRKPPRGCIDADGKAVTVRCGKSAEQIRILGLGGSMRYRENAPYMYTEKEMKKRISGLKKAILRNNLKEKTSGKDTVEILLTHAPCRGYGDFDDLAHQGFACFNDLLHRPQLRLHVYGHIHKSYGNGHGVQKGSDVELKGFRRLIAHPSGTTLVNADGYYVVECKI